MDKSKNTEMSKLQSKIDEEYSQALKSEKKGIVYNTGNASFSGYSENDIAGLPEGITKTSFGCGNPLAFSNVKVGQTVLDLGCGAGLDLLLAAKKVGEHGRVIGVDMNQDMLDKARQNIAESQFHNIELRKGMIEKLPLESNSVDWVISNCVINLSGEKSRVFSEISRILKPGGSFLISDIVAVKIPWWIRKSGILTAACAGGVISEKDYLNGFRDSGISQCTVVQRQYYDATQLAAIVADAFPSWIKGFSCCGKSIIFSLFTTLARPISKKLWSAKFFGIN